MFQSNCSNTHSVVPPVQPRVQSWSGSVLGTALLTTCLVGLGGGTTLAQEAPLNPTLDIGVVQRFGGEKQDSITIKPEPGDKLSLQFQTGQQERTITTTEPVTVDVVMEPLPEPKVIERVVLSTHRSFESAEDSANQWRSQGIEVEIAQPRQWQVWARRETYGTPLLRRLLMQNLKANGSQSAFIDTHIQREQAKASFTVGNTQFQQDEVNIASTDETVAVSFNRDDHGTRLYAGTLTLQPNSYSTYTLVNHVPLETYLRGVVPHEIGAGAPQTTIEAQAVLARTYALRNLRRFAIDNYQLCADTQCQVYWGTEGATPEADRAIATTRGLVLTYENELVDALYSSTTGGITAPFTDVWDGESRPYLKAVVDSVQNTWDLSQQSLADESNFRAFMARKTGFNEEGWDMFRWRVESPLTEIAGDVKSYLQSKQHPLADFTEVKEMKVLERSDSGRVQRISVMTDKGEVILEKDEILRALYAPNSTLFYLEPVYQQVPQSQSAPPSASPSVPASTSGSVPTPSKLSSNASPTANPSAGSNPSPQPAPMVTVLKGYAFVGGGLGHGVGMSQTGAYHLGDLGWPSNRILSFYYPGTQLQLLTNAVTFWTDPYAEQEESASG